MRVRRIIFAHFTAKWWPLYNHRADMNIHTIRVLWLRVQFTWN